MKNPNVFFFSLVLILSLSACGGAKSKRSDPAKLEPQKTAAAVSLGLFQDKTVQKMSAEAKCQNEFPVDQAPEGFKEVKLSEIAGEKSSVYQLVQQRMNSAVLANDGHVVSGTTSTVIELDSDFQTKNIASTVDCKELIDGDSLELSSSPALVFDASEGTITQGLGLAMILSASGENKIEKPYPMEKAQNYFEQLKPYDQDRAGMQASSEDLIIKAYKDADGNLEVRTAHLKPTKQFSQKMLFSTTRSYRLVRVQDGGQK